MVAPDWLPPSRPSTRAPLTSAAGCTRCAISSTRWANATTTLERPMPKPSTWPRAAAKPKLRPKYSVATGAVTILPWSNYWNAIYPNCWPSSDFPNTSGESCAPPTSSNAASSKCAEEPAPWSASSTCSPWTVSSTPSSRNSTWNGKHAPSALLHKRLDVTCHFCQLFSVWTHEILRTVILRRSNVSPGEFCCRTREMSHALPLSGYSRNVNPSRSCPCPITQLPNQRNERSLLVITRKTRTRLARSVSAIAATALCSVSFLAQAESPSERVGSANTVFKELAADKE